MKPENIVYGVSKPLKNHELKFFGKIDFVSSKKNGIGTKLWM